MDPGAFEFSVAGLPSKVTDFNRVALKSQIQIGIMKLTEIMSAHDISIGDAKRAVQIGIFQRSFDLEKSFDRTFGGFHFSRE